MSGAFVVSPTALSGPFDLFTGRRVERRTVRHAVKVVPETAPLLQTAMEAVQRGDRDAFAVIYDALADRVYGVIKRVLRDPAMSEEVAQEVFLELWRTANRFDPGRSSVAAFAVTIARRRAIDRVRGEQSRRDRVEREASQRDTTDDVEPADRLIADGEAALVRNALDQLPPDQRVVLQMAFIDGRTHTEIAERLDVPLGTVKGRVRGGLQRLRRTLDGTT